MISTRKIYGKMAEPTMVSHFDDYFRVITKDHPERVCRMYGSTQSMSIGFTEKAMEMFNNTELNSSLLIRLSLIFTLTHGVDKESIRPYTHLVEESINRFPMQVPRFWLRTRLVRELGGTEPWLLALLSYSANRFADVYTAFNAKDAITYTKKDFDPSAILALRPNTNMVYVYELLLIEYMLNKTPLCKYMVKFKPENHTMQKLKDHLKGWEVVDNPQAVKLVERLIKNEISWNELGQLASLWGVQM